MTPRQPPTIGAAFAWPTLIKTLAVAALLALAGCSDDEPAATAPAPQTTRITVAPARQMDIEIAEHVIGELEAMIAPEVATEVPGRILQGFTRAGETVVPGQVLAELDTENYAIAERGARAELGQLSALLENQKRTVDRYAELSAKKLISVDQFDAAKTQLRNLEEQVNATREALKQASRQLTKTRIIAPYGGIVDAELISPGDFIKVGVPLFRIIQIDPLRIRLPLPETMASRVALGQTVRAVSPLDPATTVTSTITEIRPTVGKTNRAINCFSVVKNPGTWKPGASVNATIVVGMHRNAVVVPDMAVVLRPAGTVVYAIVDGVARQQLVQTGEHTASGIELVSGLAADTMVAVDGAAFLTDGAQVSILQRPTP